VVELTKNGNRLCVSVAVGPAHDWFDKGGCSAVTHLNAGDQVLARHDRGSSFLEEGEFTDFSGFLLRAD
jgi:hypothetical protein